MLRTRDVCLVAFTAKDGEGEAGAALNAALRGVELDATARAGPAALGVAIAHEEDFGDGLALEIEEGEKQADVATRAQALWFEAVGDKQAPPEVRGSGLRQVQRDRDNRICLRPLSIPEVESNLLAGPRAREAIRGDIVRLEGRGPRPGGQGEAHLLRHVDINARRPELSFQSLLPLEALGLGQAGELLGVHSPEWLH